MSDEQQAGMVERTGIQRGRGGYLITASSEIINDQDHGCVNFSVVKPDGEVVVSLDFSPMEGETFSRQMAVMSAAARVRVEMEAALGMIEVVPPVGQPLA